MYILNIENVCVFVLSLGFWCAMSAFADVVIDTIREIPGMIKNLLTILLFYAQIFVGCCCVIDTLKLLWQPNRPTEERYALCLCVCGGYLAVKVIDILLQALE